MPEESERDGILGLVGETGLWWLLAAAVWLATLNARTSAELAVMAACTLPAAVMAPSARRANAGRWRFRMGWLTWLVIAAAEVPRQAAQVWVYALGRRSPVIRELALPDEAGPLASARRAAAVLALASTPGTVVLDCGSPKRSVQVHLIRRRPSRLETAVQR